MDRQLAVFPSGSPEEGGGEPTKPFSTPTERAESGGPKKASMACDMGSDSLHQDVSVLAWAACSDQSVEGSVFGLMRYVRMIELLEGERGRKNVFLRL